MTSPTSSDLLTASTSSTSATARSPSAPPSAAASPGEQRDSAYLALAAGYIVATSSAWIWLRRQRHDRHRPTFLDFLLLSLGTARLSRLISRDKILRPVRALVTETEVSEGGELREHAKGSGLVHAAGELVTCPRCAAVWAASALTLGYFSSPRSARFAGLVLSSSLISDFVNRGFALLNEVKLD